MERKEYFLQKITRIREKREKKKERKENQRIFFELNCSLAKN